MKITNGESNCKKIKIQVMYVNILVFKRVINMMIKKISFYVLCLITIITLCCVIYFSYNNPIFNTPEYKIATAMGHIASHLVWIWGCIFICILGKKVTSKANNKKCFSKILYCVAMILLAFSTLFYMLIVFWGSYSDGTYDECMQKCVLADGSNYEQCSLDTCDFPL